MTVLPRNARASNSQRGLWFQSDQKVVPELYPRRFYGLNPVVLEGYWTFGLNLNASKQNLEYWTSPKGFVIEMQVILSPFFHIWYTGTTSILSGKHRPLLGFAFTNTRKVRKVFAEGAQWNDTVSSRLWKFNVVTYGSETHYWSLCVLHESESTYIYIFRDKLRWSLTFLVSCQFPYFASLKTRSTAFLQSFQMFTRQYTIEHTHWRFQNNGAGQLSSKMRVCNLIWKRSNNVCWQ